MISISFTAVTVIGMALLCGMLVLRFSKTTQRLQEDTGTRILEQVNQELDTYLRDMMQLSDTICYRVLKNIDLEESSPSESLELLYEENRNELISIAIFQESGSLVAAAPALDLKTDVRPQEQQWFIRALDQIENQHFSAPYVQNLFQTGAEWPWVISLSRHVELTYGGETRRGVLLLDMSFSGLEKVCRNEGIPGGGGTCILLIAAVK